MPQSCQCRVSVSNKRRSTIVFSNTVYKYTPAWLGPQLGQTALPLPVLVPISSKDNANPSESPHLRPLCSAGRDAALCPVHMWLKAAPRADAISLLQPPAPGQECCSTFTLLQLQT